VKVLLYLQNTSKEVISIDPFVNDYDPNDLACSYAPFDMVYKEFLKNTLSIPNIKSIREYF